MRKILNFILLISSIYSFSQEKTTLIPFNKGDSWGFSDINRNIVIECEFDSVHFFNRNNLSKVFKNKLTGYINKKGDKIIPIRYNYCKPISNSLFIVQKENKYGIIDTLENYAIDLKFEEIRQLDSKFYLIKNKKLFGIYKLENEGFKLIIEPTFEKIEYIRYRKKFVCLKNNIEFIHDLDGKVIESRDLKIGGKVSEVKESEVAIQESEEAQSSSNKSEKYPQFIPIYNKGYKGLIIKTKSKGAKNYGAILRDTIHPIYDSINPKHWFNNCFVVKYKNKWGAIDRKGKTIIDMEYSDIDIKSMSFQSFRTKPYKQIFFVKKNDKWGVIGSTNKFRKFENKNEVLIPFKYDEIRKNVNTSFLIVKLENKYGVILSENLKLITEIKYSNIKNTYNTVDKFILINTIDENGKILFVGQNGVEFFED